MRYILALLVSGSLSAAAIGADFVITSLTQDGRLTWTNAITNASYRVEWAASGSGPWQSFSALTNLDSIGATTTAVTVSVPMFYRVVWTDPPPPEPAGEWDFSGYSFAGSLGATGHISLTNSGTERVTLGSWAFWAVSDGTNTWHLLCPGGTARGYVPPESRKLYVTMGGCWLAEGAYVLDGLLLGDMYSGRWYASGAMLQPIGTFIARRRPG